MPLTKRSSAVIDSPPSQGIEVQGQVLKMGEALINTSNEKPITKDDYWRRREERDVERDKHMAWSGLAQAALTSVSVAQLNLDNTEDGLVSLVARITDKLLKLRDNR